MPKTASYQQPTSNPPATYQQPTSNQSATSQEEDSNQLATRQQPTSNQPATDQQPTSIRAAGDSNWDRLSHLRGWPAVGWGVPVRVGGLQALWQPFLQPVPPSERRQSAPAAVVVAADPAKPGPAASKSITPAGGVGGIAPPSPQRCNRKPNGYIIRIQEGRPQDRPASLGRL